MLAFFSGTVQAQESWDWHIGGGLVVDGSGGPAFRADVLIRDDSIGYVGETDPDTIRAGNYVDASGLVVSPGFIDVHAHGDPRSTPEFRNFLAMGVTTIMLGQDGFSPGEGRLAGWFMQVEDARPAVNVAVFSGHGSLRSWVGVGRREATAREINRMQELLKADLQAGAWGMSTGLEYVPGLYADRKELQELAKVVGAHNGILMSHMRSEDDEDLEESINELAEQGVYARVHISHLKSVYGKGARRAGEILDHIKGYREQGIEFSADTYPYAASYTGIGIVFPEWAKTEGPWRQAVKERPEVLRQYLQDKVQKRNGPEAVLFGSGRYSGSTLKEVADRQGRPYTEILMEMGPNAASAAHFVMDQELQDSIAVAPEVMISSDGSPAMRHPRGYGSFARIIRRYVVEQQKLSIEEAVYKMSGLPATTLGVDGRGLIKEGYKADILVFDPEEVRDAATFEQPHRLAEGFERIWVTGRPARGYGRFSEQRFGEVLKRK